MGKRWEIAGSGRAREECVEEEEKVLVEEREESCTWGEGITSKLASRTMREVSDRMGLPGSSELLRSRKRKSGLCFLLEMGLTWVSSSSRELREVYLDGKMRDGWIAERRVLAAEVGGDGVRTGVLKKSAVSERAGVGVEIEFW